MRAILIVTFIVLVLCALMSMSCSTPNKPPEQGAVKVGDGNTAPITTNSTTTTVTNSIDKRLIAAFIGLFLIGLALPSFPKLWINMTLGGIGVSLIALAAFL